MKYANIEEIAKGTLELRGVTITTFVYRVEEEGQVYDKYGCLSDRHLEWVEKGEVLVGTSLFYDGLGEEGADPVEDPVEEEPATPPSGPGGGPGAGGQEECGPHTVQDDTERQGPYREGCCGYGETTGDDTGVRGGLGRAGYNSGILPVLHVENAQGGGPGDPGETP